MLSRKHLLLTLLTLLCFLLPTLAIAQAPDSTDVLLFTPADANVELVARVPITATALVVDDSFVYVVDNYTPGARALRAIDVTTPTTPTILGSLEIYSDTYHLALKGSCLYLADGYQLRVIDVTTPTNLVQVGQYLMPDNMRITDLEIHGEYAYLPAYSLDSSSLHIVDISDPQNPIEVAVDQSNSQRIAIAGNRAYVTSHPGLRILDISNPVTPTLLAYYPLTANPGYGTYRNFADVTVSGDYVAVSAWVLCPQETCANAIEIVDVSNPASPRTVSIYEPPFLSGPVEVPVDPDQRILRMSAYGSLLYASATERGLIVVDISDPVHPRTAALYDEMGRTNETSVSSNYAYLANAEAGMVILRGTGSIAGQVQHPNGTPVESVTISTTNGVTTTTNSAGTFTLTDLSGPHATLTPALGPYTFAPPMRTVSLFTDTTGVAFTMLPAPVSATLTPDAATTLSYSDTQGLTTDLYFPSGTVTATTTVHLAPTLITAPLGSAFTGHAFDLAATQNGAPQPNLTFNQPITLTIRYSNADARLVRDEAELTVTRWNGSEWGEATTGCGAPANYTRDEEANLLTLPICATGRYALIGPTHQQFLPILFSSDQ